MTKIKFKKRYILGTGYPWIMGAGHAPKDFCLSTRPIGLDKVMLDWPDELWNRDLPQYRLVLERVKKDEKK